MIPFERGHGPVVIGDGSAPLTVPLPARNAGDFVVVFTEAVAYDSTAEILPPTPSEGVRRLGEVATTDGFQALYWLRVEDSASTPDPTLTPNPDNTGSHFWYAYAVAWGGANFRAPDWLNLPGGVGNYAILSRADVTAATTATFIVRVALDATDIEQWFMGWGTDEAGFGLTADNLLRFYIDNTSNNPIGNGVATEPVPGLGPGAIFWLKAELDTTTATTTYSYSADPVEHPAAVHWIQVGDPVVGTNAGTTMKVSGSDTVRLGNTSAAMAAMAGQIYFAGDRVGVGGTYINMSNPPTLTYVGNAERAMASDLTQSAAPIDSYTIVPQPGAEVGDGQVSTHTMPSFGETRLIHNTFTGVSSVLYSGATEAAHTANPIVGPETWAVHAPDLAVTFPDWFVKHVFRSRPWDATDVEMFFGDDTDTASASHDENYSWGLWAIVIIGAPLPARLPISPQPDVLRLGCADEYTAWILEGDYRTAIDQIRWSQLQWERVLDDISTSQITAPDHLGGALCVARYGGLEPWAFGLRIERNDQEVWSGAVTNVRRQGNALVVSASDALVRYQKRFATRSAYEVLSNIDIGDMLHKILTSRARLDSDTWAFDVPLVNVGVAATRVLKPKEYKTAWDLVAEIFGSAVDAFMMNGTMYIWEPERGWVYQADLKRTLDGPYNTNYDFVYGTFTEEAWLARPDWSIDGAAQGNYIAVAAADTGEFGFRRSEIVQDLASQARYGVLDLFDTETLELPEDVSETTARQTLLARGNSVLELRAFAPIVVEGGTLSQAAPVDVANLRPGSLWKVDVWDQGYGQLLTVGRLKRVSVSVRRSDDGGLEEQVSPTIFPPGHEGA